MALFFVLSILFLALSLPLMAGVGGKRIARLLSLPESAIDGDAPKRLSRMVGGYLLLVAAGLFSLLFSYYLPWVIWVFAGLIVVATVALVLDIRRIAGNSK